MQFLGRRVIIPKKLSLAEPSQEEMFRKRLLHMNTANDLLAQLVELIHWKIAEAKIGELYCSSNGSPSTE